MSAMLDVMRIAWIIAGRTYRDSPYTRLHAQPAITQLRRMGHTCLELFQEDESWSEEHVNVPSLDALILVKAQPYGNTRSRWTAHAPDVRPGRLVQQAHAYSVPTIGVRQQRTEPVSWPSRLCRAWVSAYPPRYLVEQALEMRRPLYVTPDPFDDWVPTAADRAKALQQPHTLFAIARHRHLRALDAVRCHIPAPWTLTVMTDHPRSGELAWDPRRAHDLVCQSAALLIASEDLNSAPIRLLTGLRSATPVIAPRAASYEDTMPEGSAWLGYDDGAELKRILDQLDEQHLAKMSRASQSWRMHAKSIDPAQRWIEILQLATGAPIHALHAHVKQATE